VKIIRREERRTGTDPGDARLWHIRWALLAGGAAAVAGLAALWFVAWTILGFPRVTHSGKIALHDAVSVVQLVFASVAGAGALVALIVAYRKQKVAEAESAHDRTRVFNERFATIVTQLGDKNAAVQLAGVYAMAGLADDWKSNRQTCVDVLCAYLRLPYATESSDGGTAEERREFQANREVRHTVIRLIGAHLRRVDDMTWQRLNFDFTGVVFDGGDFVGATFLGSIVSFSRATFSAGKVSFNGATFSGCSVSFDRATFSGGDVTFDGATFSGGGTVTFNRATFSGSPVSFDRATFTSADIIFSDATFSRGYVTFVEATFAGGNVSFNRATFSGHLVTFGEATFAGSNVTFNRAEFCDDGFVTFNDAKFSGGNITFEAAKFSDGGLVTFDRASFSDGVVSFDGAEFTGAIVTFDYATFSGGKVQLATVTNWGTPPRGLDVKPTPEGLILPSGWPSDDLEPAE
jgi:uncharacterized protein YjbI with pentapeptide repeats